MLNVSGEVIYFGLRLYLVLERQPETMQKLPKQGTVHDELALLHERGAKLGWGHHVTDFCLELWILYFFFYPISFSDVEI